MVETIKRSMRISHNKLDDDIKNNIKACKLDMKIAGVVLNGDFLSQKAIELYIKWQYDYIGKGEQFEKAYRSLKEAMSLCGDYNV